MHAGNGAAVIVDACTGEFVTQEAFLPPLGAIVTKTIVACSILFGGGQVARGDVEARARVGVLVQGKGAAPLRGREHGLPQLVADELRLVELVAVPLVDLVRVRRLVLGGAFFFGPAVDFGADAWVVGYFADRIFLWLVVWNRARCGKKGGEEEEL